MTGIAGHRIPDHESGADVSITRVTPQQETDAIKAADPQRADSQAVAGDVVRHESPAGGSRWRPGIRSGSPIHRGPGQS